MTIYILEVSYDKGVTWKPWTPEPCISTDKAFVESQVKYQNERPDKTFDWRVATYVRDNGHNPL